jgi:integrase
MADHSQSTLKNRYPASWDGFKRFRDETGAGLAEDSEKKYKPIVLTAEELREELFEGCDWGDIAQEDIAFILVPTLYGRVKGRGGGEPSSNTLRGRYDALDAYFTVLAKLGWVEKNPLDLLPRPSSKAKDQPFLTPEEDEKLHELEKEGHELAIWALARGAGLREGEICDLLDDDVDLAAMRIRVRDGKTRKAIREVPIVPGGAVLLHRYRRWRDKNVKQPKEPSDRFVRTTSGAISKGYAWKIVKAMARRAEVGILVDEKTKKQLLTRDGEAVTRVTPHALRRTFGSALFEAGVDGAYIYPILGHGSHKVFDESYCKIVPAKRVEKILTATGASPFALPDGLDQMEKELVRARAEAALDPEEALRRLAVLRAAADELEDVVRSSSARSSRRTSMLAA